MARKSTTAADSQHVAAWIASYLADKSLSSPWRILEWQSWARGRLDAGWTPQAVRSHLVARWMEHTQSTQFEPLPLEPELLASLRGVYEMAHDGASPAKCAVVYRSLARANPGRHWLAAAAEELTQLGENWLPAGAEAL